MLSSIGLEGTLYMQGHLFLGWTLIGWIIALAMAFRTTP
jgi:hypothetical protein